jgi:hypothetical protein
LKECKVFFSEDGKQEILFTRQLKPTAHGQDRGSGAENKSLLVLFFRKEHPSSLHPPRGQC